jgi:hypothetical protein
LETKHLEEAEESTADAEEKAMGLGPWLFGT